MPISGDRLGAAIAGGAFAMWLAFSGAACAQQPRAAKLVPLESLTAQGFQVKAAVGQSGIVGTLVLQKDNEVYLCSSREIAIEPTTFECWAVK